MCELGRFDDEPPSVEYKVRIAFRRDRDSVNRRISLQRDPSYIDAAREVDKAGCGPYNSDRRAYGLPSHDHVSERLCAKLKERRRARERGEKWLFDIYTHIYNLIV